MLVLRAPTFFDKLTCYGEGIILKHTSLPPSIGIASPFTRDQSERSAKGSIQFLSTPMLQVLGLFSYTI